MRASWTLNDTFTTIGAAAESKARVTQIAEQKKVLRDGLKLEVAAAYAEIKSLGAQIDAATRAPPRKKACACGASCSSRARPPTSRCSTPRPR